MAEKSSQYQFQAEVNQLLDILTHSLYTHRDIFVRELVSNAADALDKARFKSIKGEEINDSDLDLEIRIDLDKDNKTITLSDTGIGMTKDELINNIGTIARSGTSDFVKQLSQENEKDVNLIGRFGVGFYSVFMAGEKVEITTQSATPGEPTWVWISDGKGEFTIDEAETPAKRGTQIKVFLREDAEQFADSYTIKNAIEKYSNFVSFPIKLDSEQVNTISAIWREPKSSLKKEQYTEFFKYLAKQPDDPITYLHFSADAPIQFNSLIFVPKTNLELMGFGRDEEGIHMFVKRVLVDAHSKDILPNYLRFASGVVESDELPLNISRETLQENPYMMKIKNTVVNKFLSHLQDFSKDEEAYKEFWNQHGRILKEGYNDFQLKDKLVELFRFNSSKCENGDELVSLRTYVDRMSEKQQDIYYLSGSSREAIENNPAMDLFKSKDIEVLYSFDPIDEFVLSGIMEYDKKKFVSVDQADLGHLNDIPNQEKDEEKEEKEETKSEDLKDFDNLARRIKDILGGKVEDVRLSERLVKNPAVLIGSQGGMSAQMEKIMHLYNQDAKLAPKVMEINPKHSVIKNMLSIYKKDVADPLLNKLANNLFNSVALLDGNIQDPHEMAATIQELLEETSKLYIKE